MSTARRRRAERNRLGRCVAVCGAVAVAVPSPGGLKGRGALAFAWSPERALSARAVRRARISRLSDRERAEGFLLLVSVESVTASERAEGFHRSVSAAVAVAVQSEREALHLLESMLPKPVRLGASDLTELPAGTRTAFYAATTAVERGHVAQSG